MRQMSNKCKPPAMKWIRSRADTPHKSPGSCSGGMLDPNAGPKQRNKKLAICILTQSNDSSGSSIRDHASILRL